MAPAAPLLVILVLDLAPNADVPTVDADAPSVHTEVVRAIALDGRFATVALDDAKLAAVLADRAEATCVSDACVLELGARHHADFVLRVEQARVAAEDVVALTALATKTQKRAARASAEIADPALKREGVRALTRHVLDQLAVSPALEDDPRAWFWRGGFIGGGMAAIGVGIALEMLPSSQPSPPDVGTELLAPVIIGSGLVAIGVGVIVNPFEG